MKVGMNSKPSATPTSERVMHGGMRRAGLTTWHWCQNGVPSRIERVNRFLFIPLFLISVVPAQASAMAPDYSVAVGGRTMPLGAAVSGQLGYGYLLWGEKREGDFRYGYLRPALRLQTSGVVNRAEVSLAIHPISFFGFVLGHSQGVRYTDPYTVDCATAACRGGLQSTFGKARLVLGHDRFFAGGSSRVDYYVPSRRDRPFADETSSLVGKQGGDRLLTFDAFAGVWITPELAAGVLYRAERMIGTGFSNNHESAFARWKRGAWGVAAGAGLYQSSTQSRSPTVYGAIEWTGSPSIELQ